MKSKKLEVVNPSGLHLRPAGLLCQTSMKFKSSVEILAGSKQINAKSVLSVMTCGVRCGDSIEVRCSGEDEDAALEAVCHLIETGLEEY